MSTPRDILLLGGSGFISSACARAFLASGHRVTVVTRGQRAPVPGCEVVVADRTNDASLAHALAGRRADLTVDFLAFESADVRRALEVRGFVPGRYVMISTGQVYLVADDVRAPFVEAAAARTAMAEPARDTRDHGQWEYGTGKRAAEAEVARRRAAGLDTLILRVPVVQGAGDPSRRLWAYLQRMRDGGPLLLPDEQHPVRFVWVEDIARTLLAIAARDTLPSPVYNLAMPDEPPLIEFLRRVAAAAGVTPRFVPCTWEAIHAAGLDHTVSTYSGRWCSRPDPTLALRELGITLAPSAEWVPPVVRAHLAEVAPEPHPGYERRAAELELARQIG